MTTKTLILLSILFLAICISAKEYADDFELDGELDDNIEEIERVARAGRSSRRRISAAAISSTMIYCSNHCDDNDDECFDNCYCDRRCKYDKFVNNCIKKCKESRD